MSILLTIIGIFFYILIGSSIFKIFKLLNKKSFIEKIPYSFAIGFGFVSIQMFFYSIFNISWSIFNIVVPWIFVIIYSIYKSKKSIKTRSNRINFNKNTFLCNFFTTLSILLLIFVFFEALIRPLSAWDGWAIWLLKGKIFYIDGYINPDVYLMLKDNYAYVVNLSVSFIYTLIGYVDDRVILLIFYCFYLMTGISLYFSIKKNSSRTIASIFTFLFLSTQNILRHGGRWEAGYADLALGFYIFLTVMLLIDYLSFKSNKYLTLLIIFMSITSLIKEEGMFFSIFVFFILLFLQIKNKKIKQIPFLFIYLIPLLTWQVFKYINAISFHYLYTQFNFQINRLFEVFKYMIYEFFNVKNWNLLWILFLVTLFKVNIKDRQSIIYLIIFVQIILYFMVFLISPHDPQQHILNVSNRLYLHFAPLAVYISATYMYSLLKRQ